MSENLSQTQNADLEVNNVDETLQDENNEWIVVRHKKKKRNQGWNAAKTKNFKRFGDIYEPFHSVPSVALPPPPAAVAVPPAIAPPLPGPVAPAVLPPPPPPPIPVPDLPDLPDDDDDSDLDYSTDEVSEDELTARWEPSGVDSPLPYTGNTSDELDDFHSVPNTPGPPSPRGDRTPVAGTSRGPAQQSGTFFRPLPLTPDEEKFLNKVLGKEKKRDAGPPPRSHQLRSKGAATDPGDLPPFKRTFKKTSKK